MTEKPADSPSPSSDKPAAPGGTPAPALSAKNGFAAARRRLAALQTKLATRAKAIGPVLSHSWPTAAALVCAMGVGWAGGAMHASEADPSAAARAAELDARMSQISGELRALRELTTASAASARPAKPHGDELKPALDRLGNLAGAFERVEKQDRELVARLGQLTEKVDRLEKASAPTTTASIAAAPKPAADRALPKPDPQYVARPANASDLRSVEPAPQRRVPGWSVREIVDGLALLENNRGQLIEIEQGETLRDLGRIQKFERRGRKWVVLTDKGVIEE